ncbi:MAG: hypothetical protein ACOYK6_05555 [Chthoniobacterales bacterium]
MNKKTLFFLCFSFISLSSSLLFANNESDCIATLGYRASCIQNSPSQKVTICKYYPPQDEISTSVHTDGELEIHFVDYIPDIPMPAKAKDAGKTIFPSNTDVVDVLFDKTSLDESVAVTDQRILVFNRNDVFYENGFYQSFNPSGKKTRSELGFHGEGDKVESTYVFNTRGIGQKTLRFSVVGYVQVQDEEGNTKLQVRLDRDGQPYQFPVKIHVNIIP